MKFNKQTKNILIVVHHNWDNANCLTFTYRLNPKDCLKKKYLIINFN